jgi:hypothetical protein
MAKRYGLPGPGNLRTPLEGIDLAADMLNRVATLPGAVVGDMLDAAGETVEAIKEDIASPREQPERPIPPDKLLKPIPSAVVHAIGGAVDVIKSGVDAVVQNVEGARAELDDFVRG